MLSIFLCLFVSFSVYLSLTTFFFFYKREIYKSIWPNFFILCFFKWNFLGLFLFVFKFFIQSNFFFFFYPKWSFGTYPEVWFWDLLCCWFSWIPIHLYLIWKFLLASTLKTATCCVLSRSTIEKFNVTWFLFFNGLLLISGNAHNFILLVFLH